MLVHNASLVAMRTHSKIAKEAGAEKLESITGASIHTCRSWVQRNRIPPEYWQALSDEKIASLEELAAGAAAKPRARPESQQDPVEPDQAAA
jgi:hypothetical protein